MKRPKRKAYTVAERKVIRKNNGEIPIDILLKRVSEQIVINGCPSKRKRK